MVNAASVLRASSFNMCDSCSIAAPIHINPIGRMASNSLTKISNVVSWSVAPDEKSIIASDNAPQIALSTIAGIATEGLGKSACDGTKICFAGGEVSLGSAMTGFRLDILDAEHFICPVAAGCLYLDAVAFFLADQGPGNG